jgi:bacillithiol biosynthesis cysteine-adding enzyme BshC
MGSEDADLAELGQVNIEGKKYQWETQQKGAVGRMIIDQPFLEMIQAIEGQLSAAPFWKNTLEIVRDAYTIGKTIEQATLTLVNTLFAEYGLIIVLPDNADLKRLFIPVIEKELAEQFSHKAVKATMANFPERYKVQTMGRELNLFYLKDDRRERIEFSNETFSVVNTDLVFDIKSIMAELQAHPERFSPNVILRPIFQGTILPDVAFIGGGGELAYWLELQQVFKAIAIPYPVLILRNSFLMLDQKTAANIKALGLHVTDFFKPLHLIQQQLVQQTSTLQLELTQEKQQLKEVYNQMKTVAAKVDPTLGSHAEALLNLSSKKIDQLEKKMIRAEKKKFEAKQRQVEKIKNTLFPNGSLQERVNNILPYHAQYGPALLHQLYEHSLTTEQKFCILSHEV